MENRLKTRNMRRKRRTMRVRKKVRGDAAKPRLSIFRSNKHIQAQLIDDEAQVTIYGIGTTSKELKRKKSKEMAREIGKRIAAEAKKKKIECAVFDRGPYKYHGLIAELANAAREEGLKF